MSQPKRAAELTPALRRATQNASAATVTRRSGMAWSPSEPTTGLYALLPLSPNPEGDNWGRANPCSGQHH
jgi:hypothetical protein